MSYEAIEVRPLTGTMGAEIRGVDLGGDLSNQAKSDIQQAFLDHMMIYFRDQTLTPARHIEIAQQFGKPAIYPFLKGLDEAPEVNVLKKTETDTVNFGGVWHSDTAYKECPDMGTLLYAHEVPTAGGDTLFANMYLAYETLSDGLKAMLDGLIAINNSDKSYAGGRAASLKKLDGMAETLEDEIATLEAEHPVVRTHPVTGRKSLFVNGAHTLRFKDMTEAGKQAAHRLSLRPRCPAGVYLQTPLATEDARRLGQSLHSAFRRERLLGQAPADAPSDDRRRPAALVGSADRPSDSHWPDSSSDDVPDLIRNQGPGDPLVPSPPGNTVRHPSESWDPVLSLIHDALPIWIPAFAGMTSVISIANGTPAMSRGLAEGSGRRCLAAGSHAARRMFAHPGRAFR